MTEYSVNWETNGIDVDLPKIVKVPDDIPEDEVANWLSDNYGWLVKSFCDVKKMPPQEKMYRVSWLERVVVHVKATDVIDAKEKAPNEENWLHETSPSLDSNVEVDELTEKEIKELGLN